VFVVRARSASGVLVLTHEASDEHRHYPNAAVAEWVSPAATGIATPTSSSPTVIANRDGHGES
jgi:hypothetical protein